jgi:hypothetical protein
MKVRGVQKLERKISEHLEIDTQTSKHSLDVIPLALVFKDDLYSLG